MVHGDACERCGGGGAGVVYGLGAEGLRGAESEGVGVGGGPKVGRSGMEGGLGLW